jgi:hypothetical protein
MAQGEVMTMDVTERFGVWGGTPGGWCLLEWDNGPHYTVATLEEAILKRDKYRTEFPGNNYEAAPFDPDRQPPFKPSKVSKVQRSLLQDLANGKDDCCKYGKLTLRAVMNHGLVMHNMRREGKQPGEREGIPLLILSDAGRRALVT